MTIPVFLDVIICLAFAVYHTMCIWHWTRFATLSYDARQLNCAYYKDCRFWENCFDVGLAFAAAGVWIISAVVGSGLSTLIYGMSVVAMCFGAILGHTGQSHPRQQQQRRLLSAHYMQRKYGIDIQLLLPLLEQHALEFPVVAFEASLGLTAEQFDAYDASPQHRRQMADLVEQRFVTELLTYPLTAAQVIRCRTARQHHCAKMHKLKTDWYAERSDNRRETCQAVFKALCDAETI